GFRQQEFGSDHYYFDRIALRRRPIRPSRRLSEMPAGKRPPSSASYPDAAESDPKSRPMHRAVESMPGREMSASERRSLPVHQAAPTRSAANRNRSGLRLLQGGAK